MSDINQMDRNLVSWKKIECKSVKGRKIYLDLAEIIDIRSRRTLLAQIFAMPKKNAISLADAARLMDDAQREPFELCKFGNLPGEYGWFCVNFVSWISSLGYHIELTGDECDPLLPHLFG